MLINVNGARQKNVANQMEQKRGLCQTGVGNCTSEIECRSTCNEKFPNLHPDGDCAAPYYGLPKLCTCYHDCVGDQSIN